MSSSETWKCKIISVSSLIKQNVFSQIKNIKKIVKIPKKDKRLNDYYQNKKVLEIMSWRSHNEVP